MRGLRRLGAHLAALVVTAGAVLVIAVSAPAAASAIPATPAGPAAFNCSAGYFCIYSGWNGGGTRCQWSQERLANTADNCSFIQRGEKVRSVWNNTGHRVQYYTGTNYNNRVGSTPAGEGGNLQGSYQIRSFKSQ